MTALFAMLAYLRAFVIARHRLGIEAVALRQQLVVYKRKQPRPKLNRFDRLFWVVVRRIWTNWSEALILVKPETVVSWHRAGYRLFFEVAIPTAATGAAEGNRRDPGVVRKNVIAQSNQSTSRETIAKW